jgi:hypothetical protein
VRSFDSATHVAPVRISPADSRSAGASLTPANRQFKSARPDQFKSTHDLRGLQAYPSNTFELICEIGGVIACSRQLPY